MRLLVPYLRVRQLPEYIHSYPGGLHTWEFLIWGPVIDGSFFPGMFLNAHIYRRFLTGVVVLQMRRGICCNRAITIAMPRS